ncbi:lipopolysaccharide biosynthesis protein [Calothrix sp. 336/3]|uniref:lipopolysaccharide biosynthesis protein n=1 Tax=Calothrix sp. 336/3 TaxID=1337936 RepID=UPI0004E37B98|nr:lipopolysaccharide biosynthesis protein [Calothrix sp. 336/3]AKG22687.1 polysaccharide biosynthesis protein [Calothrix sp. 336/3]
MADQKKLQFWQKIASNPFLRNLSWLGSSELIIRVFRLITTVILARFLSPKDYGLAAIVLTTYDITQVFSRFGINAKLIQIEADRLEEFSQSAYRLNWLIYVCLFCIQCCLSFPISWFYGDSKLILPICAMAVIYLISPLAYINVALLQRENRLKVLAILNSTQVTVDNILTAILAYLGWGMWAIVLPKVLVAPLWVIIPYINHSWRPKKNFTAKHWREIIKFGRSMLGIKLLETLRNNLDYLIVGRFISLEQLGLYYFAFNAGLGISLSAINAISLALLPHLCEVRSQWDKFQQRYFHSLRTISFIIIPLVLLQSSLAYFYVPIVFGAKWIAAIPILVLICLSAIPRPYADAASQLLIAVDKPQIDLLFSVAFTVMFGIALLIGVHWQAIGVASAVLITHFLCMPLFTFWATRYVFANKVTKLV